MVIHFFLVFSLIVNSPTLNDNNKKVGIWNLTTLFHCNKIHLYCIINLYIVSELKNLSRNRSNCVTIKSCLFGTVKLIRKTAKSDFIYNGKEIIFDGEYS